MPHEQNVKKRLSDLVAIESVSADPQRLPQVMNAAAYLKQWLVDIGFDVHLMEAPPSPPLIIATYTVPEASATIGIYGHYDVQSEDPVDEWKTAPFTVIEENGKLWGRGVADDKGHIIQNIAAVEELIKTGNLQNNIVFIFEGQEETGSEQLFPFLEKAKPYLKDCDFFMVIDSGMPDKKTPQIYYALRGLVYFELTVTIAKRDLHSGIYGNMVPNPANIAASVVGSMKDAKTNQVLIPHFYDDVRELDGKERKLLEKSVTTDEELKEEIQGEHLRSVLGYPPYLTSKVLPSLDINGMVAGYTGEGAKTIIPRTAKIKFSTRLVEEQDPARIEKLVRDYVKKHMPKDVLYDITVLSSDHPFYSDFRNPAIEQVAKVMEDHFGNEVVYNRSGGSIPAAEMLQRIYKKPIILTGFTLPDENLHAPNENIDSSLFSEGIEVLKKIYSQSYRLK